MGNLNCSCVNNNIQEKTHEYCIQNQNDLLNNIKEKLSLNTLGQITPDEFNKKLYSFPNTKEIFKEYDSQILDQSQKNLLTTNHSATNVESKDDDLKELINPIQYSVDDDEGENIYLFKGFVNKNYNLTGKGYYITDNYVYYGFFQNNEFNGKGIMVNKDGNSLFGDWINGVCTGKGVLKINNGYEYEGDFVNNKKQGFGIEKLSDGSRYEGEFQDNKKMGKGKYISNTGESYEGEFKDDLFEGKGTYKWPSESREYIGQFKNGNMNGKGINKFKDGSRYEGFYKNGLKHGYGKYIWPNGKVFYGNWLNNKLHGNGYYEMGNEKYNITFRFGKIISTRKKEEEEEIDDDKRIKFRFENIVNKENIQDGKKYICPICNNLLNQPQKCCQCFQNYCLDCTKDGKDNKICPNCKGNEYETNLDLLHELITKINVNCDICQTVLDYNSAINHCHS